MKIRVYPGQNLKEMRKTRSSGSDEVFGPELWFKKKIKMDQILGKSDIKNKIIRIRKKVKLSILTGTLEKKIVNMVQILGNSDIK